MDILDILLDILLKPPQPFIGLFLILDLFGNILQMSQYWHRKYKSNSFSFYFM